MKQNDVLIVPMLSEHVSQVADLERVCFADPWNEDSVGSELENPLSLWLVAVSDHRVVGYIGSQSVLGEADIMNVAVSPEFRRRGIAEMLLITLAEQSVYCMTLEVRQSNAPAITLYEKLGFGQVGCRRGYYRNPKEDALILRKEWAL